MLVNPHEGKDFEEACNDQVKLQDGNWEVLLGHEIFLDSNNQEGHVHKEWGELNPIPKLFEVLIPPILLQLDKFGHEQEHHNHSAWYIEEYIHFSDGDELTAAEQEWDVV